MNKELILYSQADNERSLPSIWDGFKEAQRKFFLLPKRNLTKEIRVAQLAGYTSEHAAYHHGEASLNGTIVGLAQNFVGSNNLPLLVQQVNSVPDYKVVKMLHLPLYSHTTTKIYQRYIFRNG